jgi:hypothetical protein
VSTRPCRNIQPGRRLQGSPPLHSILCQPSAGGDPARPKAQDPDFLEKFIGKDITLPEIPAIVFELNEVIANPVIRRPDGQVSIRVRA